MKNDYTRIAKPAEPVNGQDERATEVLPKSWTKVMRQSHFEFELHPKYWTDPRHSGDRAHLFSVNGWWEATQS